MAGLIPFLILVSSNTKKTGPIKKLNRTPKNIPLSNIVIKLKSFTISLVNIRNFTKKRNDYTHKNHSILTSVRLFFALLSTESFGTKGFASP